MKFSLQLQLMDSVDEGDSFTLCDECFTDLMEYNDEIAKTWAILCWCFLRQREPFGIVDFDLDEIAFLETAGYLLSHEDDECVKYRPLGYFQDEDEEGFCVCGL